MSSEKITVGLVGPGFIARHHIDAIRRLGNVDVVALAGSNLASAQEKANEWRVERAYGRFEELINDPAVQVVHNTTPNYLHFRVSQAALLAGKHVISDKPLALTPQECLLLRDAARSTGVANVVTFNYRGNPLIQKARAMVATGDIGPLAFVHGAYLQDWLADEHAYSWRCDPKLGGVSSALADIGSHWCDLAEHVTGDKIASVLADFSTVVSTRRTTTQSTKSFFQTSSIEGASIHISGEDVASVLVRFASGVKGAFNVGQVLPGHKNDLRLEVCGRRKSLRWDQERQSELWLGDYDGPNQVLTQDLNAAEPDVRRTTRLPPGHQQGWSDAFANVIADAYRWIILGGRPESKPDTVPTFEDGYRSSRLVSAMVESHRLGSVWRPVE
jgi:predicted dehydrogenase